LHLSDFVQQGVLVALAVGLVITLVLAWYHGEKGRQRVGGVELLIIAAAFALGGFGLSLLPKSAPDPEPVAADGITRVSMILADFENHTEDPDLALMTTEAVRIGLSGSRHLALLEPGALAEPMRRMGMDPSDSVTRDVALEIAQRQGIALVVAGRVDAVGGGTMFLAELLRPGEDTAGWGESVVAEDTTQILDAIGQLSMGLREGAGESARSVEQSDPLPEVTTQSLEALRYYARATRAGADFQLTETLLDRAIAADSTFAMAYRKLGAVLFNSGTDRTRSIESFKKAYELRGRLTEPERLGVEIHYHSDVTGDVGAWFEAARTSIELYPDEGVPYHSLANAYSVMGLHDEAVQTYRRKLELEPSFASAVNLVQQLITVGRFDEAEEALLEYEVRDDWSWGLLLRRAELEKVRRNHSAAAEHLDSLAVISRTNSGAQWRQIRAARRLARRMGQAATALRHAESLVEFWDSRGVEGRALLEATTEANIHSRLLGDQESAAAVLDQAVSDHPPHSIAPHDVRYVDLIEANAWAGRPEIARALLAEYEQRVPSDERGDPYGHPGTMERVTSQIALAAGDPEVAILLLHEARELYCHPAQCAVLLAIAHDAAAEPDSAIVWYEEYLDTPRPASVDDEYLAPSLERLAQLHDEHGDPARAEELYAQFAQMWEEADPELQPRVDAARARLGR
jgi:tetratricopeptide (TPR) repeat protein